MKYLFSLIFLIAFVTGSFSQAGKLNKSFGDSGKVLTNYRNTATQSFASAVQSDNKIVVIGSSDSTGVNGFLILRYLSNGVLDNSFGVNGKAIINFGYDSQAAYGVAIQTDGKIFVTGYGVTGFFDPVYDVLTVRLKSNGTPDSSFGINGKVILDLGYTEIGNAVCLQADGKIVIGGSYRGVNFLLLRYKTNGTPDSSFGKNGVLISVLSNNATIASIAIQHDGKILAAGAKNGQYVVFAVGRYTSDGSVDSSFGSSGFVYTQCTNYGDYLSKILLQQDGKIIAIGRTGLYTSNIKDMNIVAVRYEMNGSLDSSFGASGISTIHFANASSGANSGALQKDGKIIIGGYSMGNYVLLRLKINGVIDSSFGTGGSTSTDFNRLGDTPYGAMIQTGDSSIILAGTSYSNKGYFFAVTLAAYNKYGIKQSIAIKIRRWLEHNNGLTWDANSSISSYVVQRSYDGIHFSSIAKINAVNASNAYADPSPLSGNNYYRLQTTSTDGAVNYSNVIAVTANEDAITISPNPAKNNLQIQGLSLSTKTKITVFDFSGNVKLQAIANNTNTYYNLNIASLKAGNYLLKIETNNNVVTKNFIKE